MISPEASGLESYESKRGDAVWESRKVCINDSELLAVEEISPLIIHD